MARRPTSVALSLLAGATGREMVAICAEHPFFPLDDQPGPSATTTTGRKGSPKANPIWVVGFTYNDVQSVRRVFDDNPDQIVAVFLEPARTEPPANGFLEELRTLCTTNGAALVFDEMITGFRYSLHGASELFGVTPDLSDIRQGDRQRFLPVGAVRQTRVDETWQS